MKYQVLVALMLFPPLLAWAEVAQDDAERNRQQFEEWQKDPAHLQRLRRDAKAFFGLSEDERQKIIRFDRDFHQEDAAEQARLRRIMERYIQWLAKLPDKDRASIRMAADNDKRLTAISDLRDQEWMNQQSKVRREKYASLAAEAKRDYVKSLRQEEREKRIEWRVAERFWKELEKGVPLPARLADLRAEEVTFVSEYLLPVLSAEERERLEKAQGQWPQYPLTLVEIADRHPPALPGPKGPKSLDELPTDARNKLKNKKGIYFQVLVKAERKWPQFAIAVTTFTSGKKNLVLPHELWPWGHACLTKPMQDFVDKDLPKVMTSDEKQRLTSAEGKWPQYPVAIKEIAAAHRLEVPWHTLPGARKGWDRYRNFPAD